MCLVCLMYLLLLDVHTYDLLSNIMRGACSETTSGYLLIDSLFSILKCAIAIPEANAVLYSLSEFY